jgi:predicted NBD/HSP70 family sugar kinase
MAIGHQQSARLARYNRAVVLDLIRRFGPISKSELAERSGLAVSSVLNVLGSLSRRSLVREVGLGPSTGGRPPTLVELNPDAHFAVGVNIRPAFVEAVLMDLIGSIRSETVLPVQGGRDPASMRKTVIEAANQVMRLARVDAARVLGVGVGCPGPIRGGRVVVGIPGFAWNLEPLADQIERALGLPVILENDSNCGALAEFRHGAGSAREGCDSMVYVYVDHGVGAGIIVDRNLYRGHDGSAGEIGHTVVDADGPLCLCGNYGCLEALASVESIVRRTIAASKLGGSTDLADRAGGDWDSVSFEVVMEAVHANEPLAASALDDALNFLAIGITNLSRELRPDMIVLGGYLFERDGAIYDRLIQALERRPPLFGMKPLQVVPGELGAKARCIGGGTLVLENFFGAAQRVMSPVAASQLPEPAFEHTPVWPQVSAAPGPVGPANARIAWAGNLTPHLARVRTGEPVPVTVDVRLEDPAQSAGLKVLLHWDRVGLFGGHWATPKNSPMQLTSDNDGVLRYGVTLGTLPPGRYEYAAHVVGANDLWVRGERPNNENNGRVEVLPARVAALDRGVRREETMTVRKEADRQNEVAKR